MGEITILRQPIEVTGNESEGYHWLNYEGVLNTLEAYLGNQIVDCAIATSCQLERVQDMG